jgi:hypothetical protein
VKEVKRVTDGWAGEEGVAKVKESEKEMGRKLRASECQLKYLDIDWGQATDDKKEIVRQLVSMIRGDVRTEDRTMVDRIMRRTRIILLGKKTEMRKERGRTIYTVPVLLECQNKSDAEDLDMAMRKAGYFATFHWPGEMREFVAKVREKLAGEGYGESYFVRVRPEERGGEMLVKADVRLKNGGRFQTKGYWKCPPAQREYWEMLGGLYTPLTQDQLRRQ